MTSILKLSWRQRKQLDAILDFDNKLYTSSQHSRQESSS